MTALPHVVTTASYRNPHATLPFSLRFLVVRNTSDEQIEKNIRANAARDLDWIGELPAHDRIAVMVGGGPSVADFTDAIRTLQHEGAVIFAGNAASQYLRAKGIYADYQVLGDAKPESTALVDEHASMYLVASQVNPATLDHALEHGRVALWHTWKEDIETWFPPERVKRGGYSMIVGSSTVGDYMVRLGFVMGYREMHIFGYDSCHRDGKSHAYEQPMNDGIPCTAVEWDGRSFYASVAMKAQAEKFQMTGTQLEKQGCDLHVYGDGLLQTMWNTRGTYTNEKDKYRRLWQTDSYRVISGDKLVPAFLEIAKPDGLIIDFGCGTGRSALRLSRAGHQVYLIDFADNCRDPEAILLPFLEWDLTDKIPLQAPYGLCTDVMEHIPPGDVATVIDNIMASAERVFFNISTLPDLGGGLIGETLHLTVKPHSWWRDLFHALGHKVLWEHEVKEGAALFYIERKDVE